jgi:hypothetical protein
MKSVTLPFKITIQASQKTVFNYLSDWEKQSDWILFTTVTKSENKAQPEEINLLAITKFGPFKVVDTMTITSWQPSEEIVVEHTGKVVKGKGVFIVRKISDHSCEFEWQEITPVPFGLIGQAGLVLTMPLVKILFNKSLKKLKNNIESTKTV